MWTEFSPKMSDPVLGDEDCRFSKITQIFMDSPVELTDDKLAKLMTFFDTNGSTKYSVKNRFLTNETIWHSLEEVLTDWRGRMSNEAKLSTFVHYLHKCNLKAIADLLQKEFVPGVISDQSQNYTFTPTSGNSHEENLLPNKMKRVNDVKWVAFFCMFLPLLFLSTCIISGIIYVANLHTKIVKIDSFGSQLGLDKPTTVSLIQRENDVFNKTMVGGDDSNSWSQNNNKLPATEAIQFEGRTETELVITSSKLLDEIFNPENLWSSLVRLEFNNNLGELCEQSSDDTVSTKIYMPQLQNLVLTTTRNCENLLDVILNFMVMTDLKVLNFKATITNEIIQQMHEFLRLYSRSLEEFHIMGILENTINVFEVRKTVVLNSIKVMTVKLEHVLDTIQHQVINARFCSIFPALARFETKNILITLDELLLLQNCSHLEHINTTVRIIGDSVRVLGGLNWQEKFQSLKYVSVNFQFDMCPDRMFFEKLIKKFDMLEKYSLCSNCNLSPTWRNIHCMKKSKPS